MVDLASFSATSAITLLFLQVGFMSVTKLPRVLCVNVCLCLFLIYLETRRLAFPFRAGEPDVVSTAFKVYCRDHGPKTCISVCHTGTKMFHTGNEGQYRDETVEFDADVDR